MKNPKELEDKFFNGLCTNDEARLFIDWVLSEEGDASLKQKIEKRWSENNRSVKWDQDDLLDRLLTAKGEHKLLVSHIAEDSTSVEVENYLKRRRGTVKRWWYVAAASVILFAAYLAVNQWSDLNAVSPEVLSAKPVYTVKSNPPGQKSTHFLSEGTLIVLNSGSSVRYLSVFGGSERTIFLSGEAFFNVTKDPARPFKVIVDSTMVTALGTSFNIRSFEGEQKTSIGLISGQLVVNDLEGDHSNIYLEPGEGIEYLNSDRNLKKILIDSTRIIAWKNGVLDFNNESIHKVLRDVERWYGVEIEMDTAVEGNFTARFRNQTLKAVLEGISYSYSLSYKVNENRVTLEAK